MPFKLGTVLIFSDDMSVFNWRVGSKGNIQLTGLIQVGAKSNQY